MKKTFSLIFIAFILASCMKNCGKGRNPLSKLKKADGGVYYGGTFIYNESENFKSLFPHNITEVVSTHIASQIYEGLVRLNQRTLKVEPAIAKSWEIDSTGTVYTFHLRKNVKFHKDACFTKPEQRKVTAQDFKFVLTKLCEPSANNQMFWIFKDKVKGATDHYKSLANKKKDKEVEGIQVVDKYTLKIKLEKPHASFINTLAMPATAVFPKEAYEKYGDKMRKVAIGTGPFELKSVKEDQAVILKRYDEYWGKDKHGNQLPYLDAIKVSFIKESKSALLEFKKGNLDMKYRLPLEMTKDIVNPQTYTATKEYKEYNLQTTPALSVYYYAFQHESNLFSNKHVRKAFNYAINREKLVKYTLKGVGIPGNYGVVAPAIIGYDAKAVEGYEYNPDKARRLMEKAGYPNGKGFPELTLQTNKGGGRNIQIAEAVQKMLEENLNITINVSVLPWPQHLSRVESGKALFWRYGWIADYPDPENFLNLFYGGNKPEEGKKSYINTVRYKSATFDSLLEAALRTQDEQQRNLLYLQADQTAINDAVAIPLYYGRTYRLLQPYVKNFPVNPMEYRNLRSVYFQPPKEEEEEKKEKKPKISQPNS